MLKILLAGGLVAGLLGTTAVDSAAPGPVVIGVVTVIGNGCPAGSVAVSLTPDGASIAIDFSAFKAQVGVGTRALAISKICQYVLDIRPPQGFTYLVGGARHAGSVDLAEGAAGTLSTRSYYQGQPAPAVQRHKFAGPTHEELAIDEPATDVAVPCGLRRNVTFNVELLVSAGTSDTTRTTSSLRLSQSLILPVTLLPCP